MQLHRAIDPGESDIARASQWLGWRRWDWLLIIIVSAAVCLTALGRYGFRSTEGHRVIPAWTMLETGDWLTPRMFETPYIRKPPGLQWAIASFTMMFGRSEFVARAVSATAAVVMALLAWWFASRWFGRRWGIVAGMTQALYPQFWSSARSAEIEALNNLATLATVLMIVQITVAQSESKRSATNLVNAIGLAIAISVTALMKGPASGPVIVAAIIAGCLVNRTWNVIRWHALIGAIFIAATTLTLIAIAFVRNLPESGEPAVIETDAAGFVWDVHELHRIIFLAPIALAYALPASLALIPMWQWWHRGDAPPPLSTGTVHSPIVQYQIAQTLALTCVLSVGTYVLLGIHNVRYALPATTMLAPLAAYVIARMDAEERSKPKHFIERHALAMTGVVLFMGAAIFIVIVEPQRGATSGRDPGRELATFLPDGAVIWAEDMIEARPELLLYAQQTAAEGGREIRPLWKKTALQNTEIPPAGTMLLLSARSTDPNDEDQESERYLATHPHSLRQITEGRVHEYPFKLFEVIEED